VKENPNLLANGRFQAWWPLECSMFGCLWKEKERGAPSSWTWTPSNLVLSNSLNSRTLVILLQINFLFLVTNMKLSTKVFTKLKTFRFSMVFNSWHWTLSLVVQFDSSTISWQQSELLNSHHPTHPKFPIIMNYHYGIA